MEENIARVPEPAWDTSSHEDFFKYYQQQSLAPETMDRFRRTSEILLRLRRERAGESNLDVLDVGCGAGSQAALWLDRGHRYHGLDINRPLVELARHRATELRLDAHFEIGTATALPWPDASFDICMLPELLEHVADWEGCVAEAARVLRPCGLMYINTSSKLCPRQQEFNLPLYSWYPSPLKRYFERRAVTDWPAVANHAKYPAVNWFSFYGLQRYLTGQGFKCLDRFDAIDTASLSRGSRAVLSLLKALPPLRLLGHLMTPYTLVIGVKTS